MGISDAEYAEKLHLLRDTALRMDGIFKEYSLLLSPSALGAAPYGLASTGDPAMNAVWTALRTPVIGIPMRTAGLPLGLQIIAASGADGMLLQVASTIERMVL
jgi:Asp-tRNA(Asn)/Glu-tRNA(Gln) amidotransferase A subunit family amidase